MIILSLPMYAWQVFHRPLECRYWLAGRPLYTRSAQLSLGYYPALRESTVTLMVNVFMASWPVNKISLLYCVQFLKCLIISDEPVCVEGTVTDPALCYALRWLSLMKSFNFLRENESVYYAAGCRLPYGKPNAAG